MGDATWFRLGKQLSMRVLPAAQRRFDMAQN
jgi:hypothetical protein